MNDLRQTILVVDDTPENLDVLSGILKDEYKIKIAINGSRALTIAHADPAPDLILLDVMMPGLNGWDVCRALKLDPATSAIPVIFITAMGEVKDEALGFELGAVDYITKPVSPPIVLARVKTHLQLHNQEKHLESLVQKRTLQLEQSRQSVVNRLGKAAEYRDNETGLHVIRVSHFSYLLARACGMNEEQARILMVAAPMHDVGKIGIPDQVLLKPGRHDGSESAVMKKHVEIGVDILSGDDESPLLQWAKIIALTHHERWDGSGYPQGLKGEAIPLIGRIVTIADVFDALTSKRPYKEAWSSAAAVRYLQAESGKQFDPQLIQNFLAILPEIEKIRTRYSEQTGHEHSLLAELERELGQDGSQGELA
ncbi:MAG: two-component system response regulator [Burkholderiales bacterium]|nr:two-component system response regulator [Burkholderiales bacterium]